MTVTHSRFLGELQIIMYIQVNEFVNNFELYRGLSFLRASRDLRPIRGQGAFIIIFSKNNFVINGFESLSFVHFHLSSLNHIPLVERDLA